MLSAFAVDTALVLAHIVIDEKSNEIPAVQKLLEELDVAGHIVTLDAMHCQAHSTAKCNGESSGVEENLTRSSVAEYLSGARVEFILDLLDIGI